MVDDLVVVRGGGDLATGVIWRLWTAGFPVVVTELARPLTVRRPVSMSSAVFEGVVDVEGMPGVLASNPSAAEELARAGTVGVCVSPDLPALGASIVVDARLAKRNIDTTIDDAPLVVGLGPGFTAGVDVDAVIETLRGHRLGRCLWSGGAAPDTGTPGVVGGQGASRVLRAPTAGHVDWRVDIGTVVSADQPLGSIDDVAILAPFDGVVRGLIHPTTSVATGVKIGDVDPRCDPVACQEISDKALAIGGGVLEAVSTWTRR